MKYIGIYIAVIALTCINCMNAQRGSQTEASYDPNKKYPVEALHFDLAILKDALIKTHPGLFWYQSEKEFEDNYTRTKNSLNRPMTGMEFFMLITPFVGSIKCRHTDLAMPEAFDKYCSKHVKYFPFNVKIIDSRIYVSMNVSYDTSIVLGSEIISINGVSADSLLHLMEPYGWADGFTSSASTRIQYVFPDLLGNILNNPDTFILSTLDPNGNPGNAILEALSVKTIQELDAKRPVLTRNVRDHSKKHKRFRFQEIDSLNTAVIRIDEFVGKGYQKFLATSFRTIKNKGIKNLIIDVRGNDGGEDDYGRHLFQYIAVKEFRYYKHLDVTIDDPEDSIFKYGKMDFGKIRLKFMHRYKLRETGNGRYVLKNSLHPNLNKKPFKPHRNNFSGNVFVLIDEESFSTTTEFCAVTHYNKRATFIGRETGGNYCGNTSGTDFMLTLPKSGILVVIPLINYYAAVEGTWGRGILPHYPLKEDIQDYVHNTDSDMLFTLDLIKRSGLK